MAYDYDLTVIGASLAGIAAAQTAASQKARVALVCQPHHLEDGGNTYESRWYTWVYERWLKLAQVYSADSADLFFGDRWAELAQQARRWADQQLLANPIAQLEQQGIDVIIETGEFQASPKLCFVTTRRQLRSRTYLLALGVEHVTQSEALDRQQAGNLSQALASRDLTLQDLLHPLGSVPQSLAIAAGSPQSLEIAQALAYQGHEVYLSGVQASQVGWQMLSTADPAMQRPLQTVLETSGVQVIPAALPEKVPNQALPQPDAWLDVNLSMIPVFKQLNLAVAGVQECRGRLPVNAYLQTTNPRIYACGPLLGGYDSSEIARQEALIATQNALYWPKLRINYAQIPWVVHTNPPLASIGLTESQAHQQVGEPIQILTGHFQYQQSSGQQHQAHRQNVDTGFYKLILDRSDHVLGGHILASEAANYLQPLAWALQQQQQISTQWIMQHLAVPLSASADLPQQLIQQLNTGVTTEQQANPKQQRRLEYLEGFFNWRRTGQW
ncbi:MAG: FAD-dependent oxidoreductase [Cyanobacteria bacterium P01_H01_bin.121]